MKNTTEDRDQEQHERQNGDEIPPLEDRAQVLSPNNMSGEDPAPAGTK